MPTFYLQHILIVLANVFCGYWVADAFLDKKEGSIHDRHLPVLLGLGVVYYCIHAGLASIDAYMPLSLQLVLNLCVSVGLLWGILALFKSGIVKKIFVIIVVFVLLALGQMLYMSAASFFDGALESVVLGQGDVGVSVVQAMLALGIKALRSRKQAMRGNAQLYIIQSSIPLLSIALLWLRVYSGLYIVFTIWDIVSFVCILLINFVVYYVFEKMETVYAQNKEYALQEQRHKMLEEYYRQMEIHQKEVRTIKHDLKNQLAALGAYIAGDRDKAAGQVDALIRQLAGSSEYQFTTHPGVNALLGVKYRCAREFGIACEFDVKLPENIRIEGNDLATVLGNILDNAIEACRYCEGQRYIRFQLIYFNGSLVLSSENSTDGLSQNLESRKGNVAGHGLGMGSIQNAVRKYGGNMQHSFGQNSFTLELTLFEKNTT